MFEVEIHGHVVVHTVVEHQTVKVLAHLVAVAERTPDIKGNFFFAMQMVHHTSAKQKLAVFIHQI